MLPVLVVSMLFAAQPVRAQSDVYEPMVSRAVSFLQTAQADDGSWSGQAGPAVTALVTTGLIKHGRSASDPLVARALEYIVGYVHEDGGIYLDGSNHRNYETCLSVVCLAAANDDGRFDEILSNAGKFIGQIQWDGDEGHDESSMSFGGFGYGGHQRPDLSNTQMSLDALRSLGKGPDDPHVKNALLFVSRCQNLESPHNTTEFAGKVGDGGFYYTIAAGGSSQAGELPNGGLRSYGSMTYAGLKSMIYAGVDPSDPRVKAANEWIRKHYTLDENPGMGDTGLFYYFHTFAKALEAVGNDVVEDADGSTHEWRQDLVKVLSEKQQADGSWVNSAVRWMEGDPNLVTGYALLALSYCQPE
jgi:squalene-hopene/tetraprenyl-beta-curcumene cyclase